MVSLTGFSATADLPENSTMIAADVDIGSVMIVENAMVNVNYSAIVWDTNQQTPYFFLERIEDSRIYSKEVSKGLEATQDIDHPPSTRIFELYNARGSLTNGAGWTQKK